MTTLDATEHLESLSLVVGTLLVLFGIGTIVGMPWATKSSTITAVLQLLGVLGMAAIGAGLVWLARNE